MHTHTWIVDLPLEPHRLARDGTVSLPCRRAAELHRLWPQQKRRRGEQKQFSECKVRENPDTTSVWGCTSQGVAAAELRRLQPQIAHSGGDSSQESWHGSERRIPSARAGAEEEADAEVACAWIGRQRGMASGVQDTKVPCDIHAYL